MKLGKAALTSFLTGFGPGVGDLTLQAGQMSLRGTVALPTHLLDTQVSATIEDPGTLVIADLPKVLSFIKPLPNDSGVTLWQPGAKNNLRLLCGKTTLPLPSTDYVHSHKSVEKAMGLVSEARMANWKAWAGRALPCYGKLKVQDLYQLKSVEKVVGKDVGVTMEFDHEDSTLLFSAGHRGSATMSFGIDMEDCDGPDTTTNATSHYGTWLPDLLQCIPNGTVELYTANDYVSIFRHTEKDHLLLVMDKRGE